MSKLTPVKGDDVIVYITRKGYGIANLVCGIAITKDKKIILKIKKGFVSDAAKWEAVLRAFNTKILKKDGNSAREIN